MCGLCFNMSLQKCYLSSTRQLFEASMKSPACILFFDRILSLCIHRKSVQKLPYLSVSFLSCVHLVNLRTKSKKCNNWIMANPIVSRDKQAEASFHFLSTPVKSGRTATFSFVDSVTTSWHHHCCLHGMYYSRGPGKGPSLKVLSMISLTLQWPWPVALIKLAINYLLFIKPKSKNQKKISTFAVVPFPPTLQALNAYMCRGAKKRSKYVPYSTL